MSRILKIALLLIGFGWFISIINQFKQNPLVLLLVLLINAVIFVLFWKGTEYISNIPQSNTSSLKTNILRWFLAFFFSIFGVEIGVVFAFIIRFIIDVIFMTQRGFYIPSTFYTFLSVVFGIPVLYVFARELKFLKPLKPSIFYALFWFILMLVVGSITL